MLFSAIFLSVVVPASVSPARSAEFISKPYIVQAVIDSARIAGLPPSKAAKAYAAKVQTPDPAIQQIMHTPDPVASRRLFFRNYFHQST